MADTEANWPDDDETDLEEECGMGPDGLCSLAGTEHCDWDCPRSRLPLPERTK